MTRPRPLSGFPELTPEARIVEQRVLDSLQHTFATVICVVSADFEGESDGGKRREKAKSRIASSPATVRRHCPLVRSVRLSWPP